MPCVQTADELPHLNSADGQHVTANESNINKCAPALFAQWTQALEQDPQLRQPLPSGIQAKISYAARRAQGLAGDHNIAKTSITIDNIV